MARELGSGLGSGMILAKLFDRTQTDFPTILNIVDKYEDGKYTVLPYITRIYSPLQTINPFNLTRCCRAKTLILPRCRAINDNMIMMLPHLESLTICAGTEITGECFKYLRLKSLQILSDEAPDTILHRETLSYLGSLEELHVMNDKLRDEDFMMLQKLRVLVISDSTERITPRVLNYLPKLEICVINRKLYKFVTSTKNKEILKRLGNIDRVIIYAI